MLARQPAVLSLSTMEGPSLEGAATVGGLVTSPSTTNGTSFLLTPEARDSGVSTMESVCSEEFDMNTTTAKPSVQTLSDILLSEHNNNYTGSMDVVKLLRLRSVDDEQNQQSNSSSLESISSLENHQGNQDPDGDGGSGSTSCSEDSFEMSSTCSIRDADVSPEESSPRKGANRLAPVDTSGNGVATVESRESTSESFSSGDHQPSSSTAPAKNSLHDEESANRCSKLFLYRQPPSSISMDSFMLKSASMTAIRESINLELQNLDTGLPNLDFAKLEEQLTNAAREREEQDRKLLGEEVRRRLALQADSWKGASPAVSTRPHRSNLALRLQSAMNLQVCYMNELAESGSESEVSESDEEFIVPKSRSEPNLEGTSRPGSSKEDPYLKKLRDRAINEQHLDPCERQKLLRAETKTVVLNAKKAAQTALARYRSTKSKASGVPRQARQYLRKMSMSEVLRIKDIMEQAIYRKNLELVQLLIERDSLHMEHDSLLVDIDDFTEHETECSALNLPHLLDMMDGWITPVVEDNPNTSTKKARPTSPTGNEAPTPAPTPTTPTKAFVAQLPKSLSRFVLFRR
ncbi:SCHIP-1 domain-containing protein [Trichostrongylus colubriformis]|uniref:SCHIP-1 domain-containing protein n=1 Tax=Trichostrongylus colubriformis TaxID=6319 RepID=A0AAN8FPR0_TRICO